MTNPKTKKKCIKGYSCGYTCIKRGRTCWKNPSEAAEKTIKQLASSIKASKQIGEGEYGIILLTPEGTAVKKAKEDFSEYEVPAQKLMGEAGFAPKVLQSGSGYIEMEYLDGYRPAWNKETNSVKLSKEQLVKLKESIAYLHANGYTHNDIHPFNAMVNDATNDAKLIDFGLARPAGIFGVITDLTWAEDELNTKWGINSTQGVTLRLLDKANLEFTSGRLSREGLMSAKEDIIKTYLEDVKLDISKK